MALGAARSGTGAIDGWPLISNGRHAADIGGMPAIE
jgi:hypothetical protein